jgi:circadian clock protein KaiB
MTQGENGSDSDLDSLGPFGNGGVRDRYVLKLFVTGTTPRSARAVVNVRRICEENLKDNYDLQIIDILRDPTIAAKEQIIAAPTLIKVSPLPMRRFIGDMSETARIIAGLDF